MVKLEKAVREFVDYYKNKPGWLGNGQARKSLDLFIKILNEREERKHEVTSHSGSVED